MDLVQNLMLPIGKCLTVNQDMTVCQSIHVLESSYRELRDTGQELGQTTLLVLDEDNRVVGNLCYRDIVASMEPRYQSQRSSEVVAHLFASGLSPLLLKSMMERHSLWEGSFDQRCQEVLNARVKDCMHTPKSNEYVAQEEALEVAVHQLIIGRHQTLLVTEGENIVGVLSLSDPFQRLCLLCRDLD